MSKFRKNKIGKTDESKEKYQKIIYKLSDLSLSLESKAVIIAIIKKLISK